MKITIIDNEYCIVISKTEIRTLGWSHLPSVYFMIKNNELIISNKSHIRRLTELAGEHYETR